MITIGGEQLNIFEAINRFREDKLREGASPATTEQYVYQLDTAFAKLKEDGFKEITPETFRQILTADMSDTQYNLRASALRSFFKWAYQTDLTQNNLTEKIKMRRKKEKAPESYVWLTIEERDKLINAAKTLRQKLAIALLAKTGMRIGRLEPRREFIGLDWADINLEEKKIEVHGKGAGVEGKIRYPRFDDDVKELLLAWRNQGGNFPLYRDNGTFNKMLRKVAAKAGITKHLTAHVLKHTFCTNWVIVKKLSKQPEDLRELSAQVGTKIATLEIYLHIADQFLKSAYDETMKLEKEMKEKSAEVRGDER